MDSALIALARDAAVRHQLYAELVCAVCEQESSWNPWAIRYEPAFFSRYVEPLWLRPGSSSASSASSTTSTSFSLTEAHARATSWGLMQVMGQVAREHSFQESFLSQLCEPATGLEVGCRVLAHKLAAAEGNVDRALLLWNGGANKDYPAAALARADKYRG